MPTNVYPEPTGRLGNRFEGKRWVAQFAFSERGALLRKLGNIASRGAMLPRSGGPFMGSVASCLMASRKPIFNQTPARSGENDLASVPVPARKTVNGRAAFGFHDGARWKISSAKPGQRLRKWAHIAGQRRSSVFQFQ